VAIVTSFVLALSFGQLWPPSVSLARNVEAVQEVVLDEVVVVLANVLDVFAELDRRPVFVQRQDVPICRRVRWIDARRP